MDQRFLPLLELRRGRIVESIHYGAVAVVDSHGRLLYSYGDPRTVAFLRSSAKPLQALPFVERGGVPAYGLTQEELALICASHEGSEEHMRVVRSIQAKAGISENDLQCGAHMPGDPAAYRALILRGQAPTPSRNNCSGKHSAMLAHAKMRGLPLDTYLDIRHPVQQDILATLAEMCRYPKDKVEIGTDGCSAPNFAVPLYNAALAFARLCDPHDLPQARARACQQITAAMTAHPEMVSGPREFDCCLMRVGQGSIVCKRGAEGYQAIGLLPGALGSASPGIGIAFKIMDGDLSSRNLNLEPHPRARPPVAIEILRQIGALDAGQLQALARFGPRQQLTNHRGLVTGESRPIFELARNMC